MKFYTKEYQKRNRVYGFSLIEIMVALMLVGIITGAVAIAMFGRLKEGKISAARSQAYEISKALEIYRLQVGHYPTDAEGGLGALENPPKGEPLMDSLPLDPWGHDYLYINPGVKNRNKPDVRSMGPDEKESEDDVGNWPEE